MMGGSESAAFKIATACLAWIWIAIAGCGTEQPLAQMEPAPSPEVAGIGLPSAPVAPADAIAIADSVISGLSLRQKIGQLFITPVYGTFGPNHANGWRDLSDRVAAGEVGGLIFMRGDVYGQAMMTDELQSLADVPLWITQDMEFGAAMRVQGTTRLPPAMAIAATGSERNAFIAGAITAKEAKVLGVHQIFAPVLDVNNNPANPVINVRSYSEDPDMVAAYGIAFMEERAPMFKHKVFR